MVSASGKPNEAFPPPPAPASAATRYNLPCEACADGAGAVGGYPIRKYEWLFFNVTQALSLTLLPLLLLKPEDGVIDMNVRIYDVLFHYIGLKLAI
ncbi:MAG: hypothetical protein D5R99_02795 [Methanocalculus sp. MSAO_Arc1]|nr:MAG: hypothetical protein D5R99_02795 [Methanocalculus sp. MSAO_Arc1]